MRITCKIVLSGSIAFIILTFFSYFYNNIPLSHESNITSGTKEPSAFYSFLGAREGFSWGRTNNEGYNNLFDYDENMPIDVLIMGASHMEALQVMQNETTASRLNALLKDELVYNIGMSGKGFLICSKNLHAALQKYQPSKYVILELPEIQFTDNDIMEATKQYENVKNNENNTNQNNSNNFIEKMIDETRKFFIRKFRHFIRNNSYTRLIRYQIDSYTQKEAVKEKNQESSNTLVQLNNEKLLNELLEKISNEAEEYGVKIIILCHPGTSLDNRGNLTLTFDDELIKQFKSLCEKNEIYFLDMSHRFIEEYQNNHVLPYGFINTSVGYGHLNKYGHAMVAEELYELIEKIELKNN